VSVEIAAALRRNIPVVPLLVDGARFPLADQLPDSIKPLARRNAVEVRNAQFRRDVQALTDEIRRVIESKQVWLVRWVLAAIDIMRRRWGVVTAAALVGLLSGLTTFYVFSPVTVDANKVATEKAAADAKAVANRAAAEKVAADTDAATKAAAEKAALQKAAEAKIAADRAAEKAAAERDAAQKAAADKAAADKAAAEKTAAEKTAADKAAAAQKAAAEEVTAEKKVQALNKFITKRNRDILTNDISIDGKIGTSQSDIGACAVQCDDTPACKVFSFDHVLNKCYLKTNVATSVIDPQSTIAVKSPLQLPNASSATADIELKRNTRIMNNDPPVSRKRVTDFNSCKATCLDSLSCVAFTFLKAARDENCEMFDGLKSFLSDDSADSGYKSQSR
jgi:hypothetical protein